jgi:hypothetical protein
LTPGGMNVPATIAPPFGEMRGKAAAAGGYKRKVS